MAVSKQQVIIEFDADTGDAQKSLDTLQTSTENVGKAATTSKSDFSKMGSAGKTAFNAVGTAIKASGIGLLVGILAKLVAKFAENKTIAEGFATVAAGLGTVLNDVVGFAISLGEKLFETFSNPKQALIDFKDAIVENIVNRITGLLNLLPSLGEAISLVFSGKFGEAGKVAADAVAQVALGVTDFTDKVTDAAVAVAQYASDTADAVSEATALERSLQALTDAERDLAVQTAQSRAEVEELKRQRDDERLSIEERIAAAEKAAAIDKAIADENVRIQEEKANLLREEIRLQGETEERLNSLAEAEIAAADARGASAAVQTELQTSLFGLNQEVIAQQEEQAALEAEQAQADLDAFLANLQKQKEAKDKATAEDKKRLEIEAAAEQAAAEQRVALRDNALVAIGQLASAFAKDTEASQKKAFKINKAIQLAQATIETARSVQAAYLSQLSIPTPDAPIRAGIAAGIAGASGAAQIAIIAKTKFQGGGGTPPSSPSSSGGGLGGVTTPAGAETQAPQLDLGFLGEGAGQTGPLQAYVVSENVSNAQQANQKIQEQASL
jgi:hypothetical protein